ncbi:DEAD/DEAH box helicase family protein [Accumulibacter sp.]|uniref:DEAD/DEAH box helicase family protein n=1 Tax=Accumulibacter sp. TaxID=2053492 RepID=UPI002879E985|nr:DEAD/DEAH box helicase family protein [Accumulibacter sp.]MDS4054991.1 DEAD/DEAH box helicase family protein [Accumulibacter sp.]
MKAYLEELNSSRLLAYQACPDDLEEDFGIEEAVLAGGYGYRQILELVQNGADALLEAQECGDVLDGDGRIHVQLHGSRLYVANTGAPLSKDGLKALLQSHRSPKRSNQIGRFGLGFKSLLKLNGRIDVFTRASGAIRFDPERCRDELRHQFGVTQAPALRLAWALPPAERAVDPLCTELAWAETIVRVEVGSESLLQHIRQEIRSFPAEFLLFFPIAATLLLDDDEKAREVRLAIEGAEHVLHDGEAVSRWRIAAHEVRITEARAIADATHIHARESVPLSWAMPLEGRREEAGRFWAFFPTHTQTYLPGILNAPWKLNSDRNAIIGGEWNAALMAEAARLIADTLPSLATPDDPGRPLEAFPRQLDRKDEDAAPLVDSVWTRLRAAAVIPDGTGALRRAQDLRRHPKDTLSLATNWQSLAGTEQQCQLVHASCLERQRASRLNALAERIKAPATSQELPALRRLSTDSWFGMVARAEPEVALSVLRLAESFSNDVTPGEWNQARPALAIIPTQSGKLVTAGRVVLAPEGVAVPDRESVAGRLRSNPEGRRLLKDVLRVSEPDDQLWRSMLTEAMSKIAYGQPETDETGWQAFWSRLRLAPEGVSKSFVASRSGEMRVRRRDGKWVQGADVLLPGTLVPEADTENGGVLIDLAVHDNDRTLLDLIGVKSDLRGTVDLTAVQRWPVFRDWLDACQKQWFSEAFKGGSRPQGGYLQPLDGTVPTGLNLLALLRGAARARLTLVLFRSLQEVSKQRVKFGHSTRTDSYPTIDVAHPLPWLLLSYGEVQISASVSAPLKALVARRSEAILQRLPNWNQVDLALSPLEEHLPQVSVSQRDLHALWTATIAALATPESIDDEALTDLWLGAAKDGVVPAGLPSPTGRVPLGAAFVTTSADLARRARTPGRVVVVLDPPTMQLWLKAGAQNLAGLVQAEWSAIAGPPERLIDVVPELGDVLRADVREAARCQRVTQLRLRIADTAQAAPCLMSDGALLLDAEQLAPLSRAERLRRLLAEITASGWLDGSPADALARLGDAGVDKRREHVAQGATLAERLLRAAGNRVEPLLDALGQPLRDMDFVCQCAPQQLAELVLAQLGPAALTTLRDTLQAEGLQPPTRWNSAAALAFVAAIGFPPEFASATEARREPEELISGPIELPPLHDFQREVFDGLSSLLASGTQRRRAVISLPTGGGKTRVTVEAAVRLVLTPAGAMRSVLWIAQTDELCEQAVQAFRQVWVNLGARRTNLRIARLWGGNPNPTQLQPDRPVVVVASIQTLNNRVGAADLDWLRKPGLVVVDECHHAITPSYSTLLRWLDAEAPRPGATPRDEPLIVGLSATPFRTNDDESQRLARRFDNRWLPSDQEQLYARLRSQGVLARAQYESLDSGVGLTDDELTRLGQLGEPWEGLDFENLLEAINQRLAGDTRRNERLVECIEASVERSVLFFTNSVAHAEEMAARLTLAGVGAAAISGSTPTVARRYFLDRFQGGQIRVLCNHSVLTTGFDAPRTDLVLIARQVFSPVRYMQMVGRGLRGEKNGGTASCRIVTVVDNLGRFADRHPYHYCRHYFSAMDRAQAAVEVQS